MPLKGGLTICWEIQDTKILSFIVAIIKLKKKIK